MKAIILMMVAFFASVGTLEAQGQIQEKQRPILYGDGIRDDTDALNAWGRGERVIYRGRVLGDVLERGTFLISWKVEFKRRKATVRYNTFIWRYRGYNRLDWVIYHVGVRYYGNRIIDTGIGDNPFENRRRYPRPIYRPKPAPTPTPPSTPIPRRGRPIT